MVDYGKVGGKAPMLSLDQVASVRAKAGRGLFRDREGFMRYVWEPFRLGFDAESPGRLAGMGLAGKAERVVS